MACRAHSKSCARRGCERRIQGPDGSCYRSLTAFMHTPELCQVCLERFCSQCSGRGCAKCDHGRLTERQVAQRVALRQRQDHYDECDVCSREPVCIAFEDYNSFIGDRLHSNGSRMVFAPPDRCPQGAILLDQVRALGAELDECGIQEGWDGCDWAGEPLVHLEPGYREVVRWRREVTQEERDRWKEEDQHS